jgi:[ribosomal protein S5]-alanine N-acetyltransferase
MLDHARDSLRLRIVYAIVLPDNVRSIGVVQRLGMTPLGPTKRYYGKESLHFVWETE